MSATKSELIARGLAFLDGAPDRIAPAPDGLLGFAGPIGFICQRCSGRIIARGCSLAGMAPLAVWQDGMNSKPVPPCDLCTEVVGYDIERQSTGGLWSVAISSQQPEDAKAALDRLERSFPTAIYRLREIRVARKDNPE